ncbi:MAG TPA: alpha-2-macroglobulin family protein, partial [Chroococcales cyanobacterium]
DYSARYSIKPRPSFYSFFDGWDSDDSSYYSDDYTGDYLTDGYITTDANGDGVIEYNTNAITTDPSKEPNTTDFLDKRYTIQAEVTDISRMTVVGSGKALGTPGNIALFVTPDSYVTRTGDSMGVTVEARTYDGQPVANQKISLQVARLLWDRNSYESRGSQMVADLIAITGSDGKAHANIKVADQWPSDSFYISAISKDSGGHRVFDSSSIWVDNYRSPYVASGASADHQPVTVKLDKPVYQVGDTAKIMITAPVHGDEGVEAIVSVEGLKLYDIKTVPMNATAVMVEVPIKAEYMPNAYFDVVIVDAKRQYYTAEQMLKVSPQPNFLNISIKSDKEKYKPGETVKYTIKAEHADGKPAANTELSLGVVDESIYSVRPEAAPDIQKFFYSKRENNVLTSCSFPEEYSGGPDKDEPKVRKDFKDVAAWLPELVTNKDGIAAASIKMPDNLTTWRATVRGIDMDTDVGSAIQKVMCTQDLICRLALPRFFSEGDEGLVTAVVHNYSSQDQHVALTLTVSSNFKTTTALTQKLDLAPEKAGRFSWPVTIGGAGTGT